MPSNKFFVDRRSAPDYGDRIEFAVSLDRSLTIKDASDLCTIITKLINAPKPLDTEREKLRAFLMGNFKNETGNETPEACAIRLLSKAKSRK